MSISSWFNLKTAMTDMHCSVRFMTLGVHACSIHPFTACSLPSQSGKQSELVFYIRPRGGLTSKLAQQAKLEPGSKVRALLDGPYGGVNMEKIQLFQHQVVIAGGSGAGWILPMLSACLRRNRQAHIDDAIAGPSTMKIVLATRDRATRLWFQQAVDELLSEGGLERLPSGIDIDLHFTGQEVSKAVDQLEYTASDPEKALEKTQVSSQHDTESDNMSAKRGDIKRADGRPNLATLVNSEIVSGSTESLGVFVCGPLSMQSVVSNAVAAAQLQILKEASKDVYLHMEHFSWA